MSGQHDKTEQDGSGATYRIRKRGRGDGGAPASVGVPQLESHLRADHRRRWRDARWSPSRRRDKTLAAASKAAKGKVGVGKVVGKPLAERAKEKGIVTVCFDRGGYLYHGRVKALADGARDGGLEF